MTEKYSHNRPKQIKLYCICICLWLTSHILNNFSDIIAENNIILWITLSTLFFIISGVNIILCMFIIWIKTNDLFQ